MSVGYTPESFGLIILGGFAAAIAVSLTYWLIRLVLRLLGVKKGDTWGFAIIAALLVGLFFTASVALDVVGEHDTAVVTSKQETLRVTRRGGWNRTATFGVRTTSGGDAQQAMLSASPARYDALAEGDTIDVRVLRYRGLSLIRDAALSTRTWVPWTWVTAGALAIVVVVMVWKLVPSVLVIGGVLLFIGYPIVQAARDQAQADDESAMTARATGTVVDVTRVTEWHLGSRRGSRSGRGLTQYTLPQPYDVVEVEFTPPGARGKVLAVDAVDAEAPASPLLPRGATVNVRYAAADPRDVHIDGHTRRWHWRDMAHVYSESALVIAVLVGLAVAGAWFTRRVKRALTLPR